MKLQPIVYVANMGTATSWYSALLGRAPDVSSEYWTTFPVGDGHLALHLGGGDRTTEPGRVALSFVADEPLEMLIGRVEVHRSIAAEAFGRSFVVADPDGTLIQINEHAG